MVISAKALSQKPICQGTVMTPRDTLEYRRWGVRGGGKEEGEVGEGDKGTRGKEGGLFSTMHRAGIIIRASLGVGGRGLCPRPDQVKKWGTTPKSATMWGCSGMWGRQKR